jgi:UDP-N-acetylmuramoylalanine--D-glutamate ligase
MAQANGLNVVLLDEAGQGDRTSFEAADVGEFAGFIFSPGFAAEHPWRRLAERADGPCLSELAFAAKYWRGRIIGVTGTNGKTTLTALLQNALQQVGEASVAAGNIGYPLSEAVCSEANVAGACAVVEISSFQAELCDGLELDALLWTNFAEDHLDRYGSMEAYFDAKARLFGCLRPGGVCVVGSVVVDWMALMRTSFTAFTKADPSSAPLSSLSVASVFRRQPYAENFSLASELWRQWRLPMAALIEAADTFSLAPHRLSLVAKVGSVSFWDDSKATNFHAALAALAAIERPIVWIGGGRTKGGDVEGFARQVAERVDVAILYGEVAGRLAEGFRGALDAVYVHPRFEDAVRAAGTQALAWPQAHVLLSPGFASFDQFASYGARGKSFLDMVLSLKNDMHPR